MLNKTGFDLWADGYDKAVGLSDISDAYPFAGYKKVLNAIYQAVLRRKSPTVLDIGFGTGTLTAKLYEMGCQIWGQDFSDRMLALAQPKMPEARLFQGDFTQGLHPDLQDRKYDFIVSTYALHHLTVPQKLPFLKELLSHLNPGGRLLIGDVAFQTRRDLERCREEVGPGWDEDECYFVYEELLPLFPLMTFQAYSYCAGVLTLEQDKC